MINKSELIITSTHNPLVVKYSKLKDEKYRASEGLFLCEGAKLVRESLDASVVLQILCRSDKVSAYSDIINNANSKQVDVVLLSEAPFLKISTEKSPQGIISVCTRCADNSDVDFSASALMCCEVRDPGNLGTIIRTAAGLGFESVILNDCADVYNPKSVRASMGALFRISIFSIDDPFSAVKELRKHGRRVIAAAVNQNSVTLGKFDIVTSDVFVIGNEGRGLDHELIDFCDAAVSIELKNGVESFNAAIAAGIILWEQSKTLG